MYNYVSKWLEGLVFISPLCSRNVQASHRLWHKMSQFFQCLHYNNWAPIFLEFSSYSGFIPSYIFGTPQEMLTFSLSLSSLMLVPPPRPVIPLWPAASAPARSQLDSGQVTSCPLRISLLPEASPCSLVVLCVRNGLVFPFKLPTVTAKTMLYILQDFYWRLRMRKKLHCREI